MHAPPLNILEKLNGCQSSFGENNLASALSWDYFARNFLFLNVIIILNAKI